MIGGSVQAGALSSLVTRTRSLELVSTAGADVDKLVLGVEHGAFSVGSAVIAVRGELWGRHSGIHILSSVEGGGIILHGFHYGRPC